MLLFMRNGILILCEHSSQLSGPAENRNPKSLCGRKQTQIKEINLSKGFMIFIWDYIQFAVVL